MNETSKAMKRRYNDAFFQTKAYVGRGIDVGCGRDPLSQYVGQFALMTSCRGWDKLNGDAQKMKGVAPESYDFLHSSHCLEHLNDPSEAMLSWSQVVKPGGHMILTVPDFDLYEGGVWPSRWNSDHKWKFTMSRRHDPDDRLLNVLNWLGGLSIGCGVERIQLVRDFWEPSLAGADQTRGPNSESCIEFVLRKYR